MGVFSVRKTTEQFIEDAKAIHGDKYDYSRVDYKTNKAKVCIVCPIHGEFWQTPNDHLSGHGCKHCGNTHSDRFFGICDVPNAKSYKSYSRWMGIINRCYRNVEYDKNTRYADCVLCDEWTYFSNFNSWFEDPENGYQEGYEIDKDILVKGNKVYSPETCCFVPPEINKAVMTKFNKAKESVGVWCRNGKFEAYVHSHGKTHFLGTYTMREDAFTAYKNVKKQYIKELAEKYFQEGKITKKVYDALMKYEI